MSVIEENFKDRDEQAVWELIGRHESVEPSFGFIERTLRRLDQPEIAPRRVGWFPLLRWAMAAVVVAALGVVGWNGWQHKQQTDRIAAARAETYAAVQQGDYLEDFDVIASLDQLNGKGNL